MPEHTDVVSALRDFLALLENGGSGEELLVATLDAEEALTRFREWVESKQG